MTAFAEPHVLADRHFARVEAERVHALRHTECRRCRHCNSWMADTGDGAIEVGWCSYHEMPLARRDLDASIWDMCDDQEDAL